MLTTIDSIPEGVEKPTREEFETYTQQNNDFKVIIEKQIASMANGNHAEFVKLVSENLDLEQEELISMLSKQTGGNALIESFSKNEEELLLIECHDIPTPICSATLHKNVFTP